MNGRSDMSLAKTHASTQQLRDEVLATVSGFIDAVLVENSSLRRDVKNLCTKLDHAEDAYNEKCDEVEALKGRLTETERRLANVDFLLRGVVKR